MTGALRFCMVTTFYPPFSYGGDGVTIQRLCRALVRAGHSVTVVHDADAYLALGHKPPSESPADDGVEVVTLRSGVPRLSSLLTHQLGRPVVHGRSLSQLLGDGAFDVVHFHNVSLVGGPGVLSYARGAATLYTAHEHWLVCPTHVLWRHGREPCPERECLRCTLRQGRPPQLWRGSAFFERQLDHVDAFIALSEFSRAKHREFGFTRPMEVLPPLVTDPDTGPEPVDEAAPHAPPHPRPYFLCVGRLERIKGIHSVVPLFRDDAPADLVIAGTGSDEHELRSLAAASPRIHFVGWLSADRLRRYYRHAIAHVAASVCYETFGNTVVESLQQRAPVVARALGPFPELIDQSGGGILFSNAPELRSALDRLAADPQLRRQLGEAGRRAFDARWSESAVLPKYLDLVDRVRGRQERSPAAEPTMVS